MSFWGPNLSRVNIYPLGSVKKILEHSSYLCLILAAYLSSRTANCPFLWQVEMTKCQLWPNDRPARTRNLKLKNWLLHVVSNYIWAKNEWFQIGIFRGLFFGNPKHGVWHLPPDRRVSDRVKGYKQGLNLFHIFLNSF